MLGGLGGGVVWPAAEWGGGEAEVVDFGAEGFADLGGGAGEVEVKAGAADCGLR